MKDYMTVLEVSEIWNVPKTQVTKYCREDRIDGAIKDGKCWMIPKGALKPEHGRIGKHKSDFFEEKRPLPIGVSSYVDACSNYYYIDKTMLIKEFLDERSKVSLFTRPRRFGKTLNMDMLKVFFEKQGKDTTTYFTDKAIWKYGAKYTSHQGKYPVIYLSFKDVKCDNWEDTYCLLKQIIDLEYFRHFELVGSEKVSIKGYYEKITSGQGTEADYAFSLKHLSQMLDEHYGVAPIVIIDEYDTPIQQGYIQGFYDKIVGFMRNLFSGVLKDNEHLSFGFLTGILRVAKESIFSGLNNLKINSVLDEKYSQYFGFTAEEVKKMVGYYGVKDKYDEICTWYDGYLFGDTEIFNPWSVINYLGGGCKPRPFWENTGNNTIIGDMLAEANGEICMQLNQLLQGEDILTVIDTNVIYPELKNNPSSIYSFLLVSGYLKMTTMDVSQSGDFICRVSLPNTEIAYVYRKEIIEKLSRQIPQSVCVSIQEALYLGDSELLKKGLQRFLLESVSSFDLIHENSYHMLMLGLCAMMSDQYRITSNRESGMGRFDIQLTPKNDELSGILIELKAEKNCSENRLMELAQKALEQINLKQYETDMKAKGIHSIIKYGVAFSGKNIEVIME